MATWAELAAVVEAFDTGEGVARSDPLYRYLANRALAEIGARIGHFDTHWNNDSTDATYGTLTLSGREVTFPGDLVEIGSVYWSGDILTEAPSTAWLDGEYPLWRSTSATPSLWVRQARGLIFDSEPTGSTDGLLVVYGLGSLPHFAEGGTVNPLTYLQDDDGLTIADYMIANRPMNLLDKSDAQIAAMQDARLRATVRWERGLNVCTANFMRRTGTPLGG